MNIENIIHSIEQVDPEVYDKLDSRRKVMKRFSFIGKTLALAAVPTAFGAMFNKAYGQSTTDDIKDVLAFAYLLENLEYQFYQKVVDTFGSNGIPAGTAQGAMTTIRDHEMHHVDFLKAALTGLGGTPTTYTAASFDFSGGQGSGMGPLGDIFNNKYAVLLAVAQTFEDTGVRAYKGQAPRLISNNDVLQAALQIHSVEARHASHIRQMRRNLGAAIPAGQTLQPWITLNQSGIDAGSPALNALIAKSYAGEEAVAQANVPITNIGGQMIGANEASEAFDEPLTKAQVQDIVTPFLVP